MKMDFELPDYKVELVLLEDGQVVDWGHVYLQAQEYYGVSRGEGSIVFIVDTAGTFSDHPDLVANCLPELDRNVTNSPDPDFHGHGTHCAGIAAASDNQQGVIGIAPGAKLVALKALNDSGSGSFSWVADQIRYVADLPDSGAVAGRKRIVSMSLGGPAGSSIPADLKSAIDYAIGKGVFILAAAGNSGYDGSRSTVGPPGNYEPVIAVASTDRPGDRRSSFSSGGATVDVAAPGGRIYSTHKGGGYALLSGTSMACPQVAGVVALLLSANSEISTQGELMAFLQENATDILGAGKDNESGYGTPRLGKFIDQDPPEDDNPGDDDPIEDDPEEPEFDLPTRRDVQAVTFPFSQAMPIYWRSENAQGMSLAFLRDFRLEVVSNIKSETMARIVDGYVRGFFAGRAMVLLTDHDLYDAGVWAGAFMQFIADDDWVFERFGVRMNLRVLELTIQDHDGVNVRINAEAISSRANQLKSLGLNTAGVEAVTFTI